MRTFLLLATMLILPLGVSAQSFVVSDGDVAPVPELYINGPAAPVIYSAEFLDENKWYQPQDATFNWELPVEVVAIAADVYTVSGKEPMTSYRPPVSSFTVSKADWQEGDNFLSVQFKNAEKWGMYAERLVKIDATPPQDFSINVRSSETVPGLIRLSWGAHDELSGISHYLILVDDGRVTEEVGEQEAKGYVLDLRNETQNQYRVRVVAYDQAGNSREENLNLVLSESSAAEKNETIFGVTIVDPVSVLAAIMAAMMLLLLGYTVHERQRYARNLADLEREAEEVHSQLLRIFSALREEIYDQIKGISKKGRLSKGEKAAVEGLNKALSVSEALIDREIQDVKKLLD